MPSILSGSLRTQRTTFAAVEFAYCAKKIGTDYLFSGERKEVQLCDAVNSCNSTKLAGWDMVAYVNRLVNKSMKYSVEIPFASYKKAFRIGKGYCVQQAFCTRDILRELGYNVQVVYCRKAVFEGTETISGHTWCRVYIANQEKDVCTCNSDNCPGKVNFPPVSKVKEYSVLIVAAGYLGSIPVCFKRLFIGKAQINRTE